MHSCGFSMKSTFLCANNSTQRHSFRRAVESSGLVIRGQDSLSFRHIGWKNLEKEMTKVKGQEQGENDLHLEKPGLFAATLYPEIFGVPEEWMLLLSQVIRLGNEKDAAEHQDATSSTNLKDFVARAKAIERCISELKRPSQDTSLSTKYQRQIDRNVLDNMLDAMSAALAIYFYRRIYDVDSSILQQKVVHVRDCLLRCEHAVPSAVSASAGFIWTAFIAACEAEDLEVQASYSSWFKSSAQRSGLSYFTDTLKTIENVWHEKLVAGRANITWLDLMKERIYLCKITEYGLT